MRKMTLLPAACLYIDSTLAHIDTKSRAVYGTWVLVFPTSEVKSRDI